MIRIIDILSDYEKIKVEELEKKMLTSLSKKERLQHELEILSIFHMAAQQKLREEKQKKLSLSDAIGKVQANKPMNLEKMRKITHDAKIQLSDDITITVHLSENYNPVLMLN